MRVRRIPLALPNTSSMHRKRHTCYMRVIVFVALAMFMLLQLHAFTYTASHDPVMSDSMNDSVDAILSNVPKVLHKFLTQKTRNHTTSFNAAGLQRNGSSNLASAIGLVSGAETYRPPNISEIKRQIERYNEMQLVLNEDTFGPLQNDSVIIVIQVHTRITYLRHLIVSLAQASDISKTLLIFSHDFYDEDINDLVQSIDFCKVMQIFYPHSIQTHPHEFPGVDPLDCPRDIHKEQALLNKCNNALHPDLYGHYREAKFTQTKHHWWWKANRVFDQLEVTRNHTGLVLFLEEDHYVAEDFLYLLDLMHKRTVDLCPSCNILSLGTYLKTFNYYTYNGKNNRKPPYSNKYASLVSISSSLLGQGNKHRTSLQVKASSSSSSSTSLAASLSSSPFYGGHTNGLYDGRVFIGDTDTFINTDHNNINMNTNSNANARHAKAITTTSTTTTTDKNGGGITAAQQTWSYHVLPSLYSAYQKVKYRMTNHTPKKPNATNQFREVEVMPWISSKHNMGFAFNRTTWSGIRKCNKHFCSYDDYNWDWSLQHVSQHCLQRKLHAMIVKGPRVFHIGECGVHHKKKNCESNQVISKVQQVLRVARKLMYPRKLTLTVASIIKKTKLRKGNGGWGDKRDHDLCVNMTLITR